MSGNKIGLISYNSSIYRSFIFFFLLFLVDLFSFSNSFAQNANEGVRVPHNKAEIGLSFSPIVKAVAPAVVNIYASRKVSNIRNPFEGDPFFEQFFGGFIRPDRGRISVGSGVIVAADGIIVTNNHVIEGMSEIKVALADKREFEAEVKIRDAKSDLSILQIKSKEAFPFLEFGNSENIEVGDLVLAIGNPFGVGQTVTQGIVSALARGQVGVSDYQFFIQTDAAINPGNSGGALVDMKGRLIGINTAIFSKSGGSHGIGFAIPSNMVRSVVASAKVGGGVVRRPWFGASLQSINQEIAESLALKHASGALVAQVYKDSPAAEAAIQKLDVIIAVDNVAIDSSEAFGFQFATKILGGNAKLSILRAGKPIEVSVKLSSAPEIPTRDPVVLRSASPFQGGKFINISPAVREEFSIISVEKGVVIEAIEDNSSAEAVGFQKGDVIISVNGQEISDTQMMESATKRRFSLWKIKFLRGGQVINSVLGG